MLLAVNNNNNNSNNNNSDDDDDEGMNNECPVALLLARFVLFPSIVLSFGLQ